MFQRKIYMVEITKMKSFQHYGKVVRAELYLGIEGKDLGSLRSSPRHIAQPLLWSKPEGTSSWHQLDDE